MARRTGRVEVSRAVISYLVDSSAVWRLQRHTELADAWSSALLGGAIGSCEPQRAEFRRSARNAAEFDQMNDMFSALYPDVAMPKSVWRWIDSAQSLLASAGVVRALSVVDLLVCATASARGLVVLHDDPDFDLTARHLRDVDVQRVLSPEH